MTIRHRDNQTIKKRAPVGKILLVVIAFILICVLIYFFRPQTIRTFMSYGTRVKNTFSYYALKEKPHFYYLAIEKNGHDIRVDALEAMELTYRDEFAVKSVGSDDLTGRYTTVNVEGLGQGNNDRGVLFRGVDLVNKIMTSGSMKQGSKEISDYKIRVNYKNDIIAVVALKVIITPQDWLRFAKDSANVNEQINYLRKAIALNKQDTGLD